MDIALEDPVIRELARRTIPPGAEEPMGVYVFGRHTAEAELALAVERSVFYETFGNTPELLAAEYEPYDDASVFICVLDHRRAVPAGTMRIIVPSLIGLKSLNDIEGIWGKSAEQLFARSKIPYEPESTWDIATLAVSPEYRGAAQSGLVSLALYQTLSLVGRTVGVNEGVAILHQPVYELVQRRLQRPFRVIGGVGPRAYLDSPASLPVHIDHRRWYTRLRVNDPVMFEILYEGQGLGPAVRTPDWEEAAACFRAVVALNRVRGELGAPALR